MTLVKWNSRNSVPVLTEWDRLFNSIIGNLDYNSSDWIPSVDVNEDEKAYTISMDLPGMTKKDISISIRDQILSVSGKRENKSDNLFRSERRFGSFSRSFNLPDEIKIDKVDATFNDGVLTISIPRIKPVEPKEITVKIN